MSAHLAQQFSELLISSSNNILCEKQSQELLTALSQAFIFRDSASPDHQTELLEEAPFRWIPLLTPLTSHDNLNVRTAACENLGHVAQFAASPREVILALLEWLHFINIEEDAKGSPDETQADLQVIALLDVFTIGSFAATSLKPNLTTWLLHIAFSRLQSKKPQAFISQLSEGLFSALDNLQIHDKLGLLRALQSLFLAAPKTEEVFITCRNLLAGIVLLLFHRQEHHLSLFSFRRANPRLAVGFDTFDASIPKERQNSQKTERELIKVCSFERS